jgi:competence protein ComFC
MTQTALATLRQLGLGLAAIVFPPHCAVCEEPAATALCVACAQCAWRNEEEPVVLPGLDGVDSVGEHAGALREAILALKYGRRRVLAAPLGELLARRLAERQPVWQVELIVPVPSHPRRRRERGVNQTALLARALARRAELPVEVEGLRRTRYTVPQTALTPAERRLLGEEVPFAAPEPARVAGRRVLVIDDVATTGSTLSACAAALRKVGAAAVFALTLSHGGT